VSVSQHAPYYWPYVLALLIGLVLIICLPELSLTIPRSAGFVRQPEEPERWIALHCRRTGVSRRASGVLRDRSAGRYPRADVVGPCAEQGRHRHLAAHFEQARLGRLWLAEGIWRPRLDTGAAHDFPRGEPAGARSRGVVVQHHDARPGIDPVRHRGAEAALSAARREYRRLVVPGFFRAGRGIGPRLAEDRRQ